MSDPPLILNVDDNDAGRYAKSRILQRGGYRVVDAMTGAQAIESVRRERPEVVTNGAASRSVMRILHRARRKGGFDMSLQAFL